MAESACSHRLRKRGNSVKNESRNATNATQVAIEVQVALVSEAEWGVSNFFLQAPCFVHTRDVKDGHLVEASNGIRYVLLVNVVNGRELVCGVHRSLFHPKR